MEEIKRADAISKGDASEVPEDKHEAPLLVEDVPRGWNQFLSCCHFINTKEGKGEKKEGEEYLFGRR